MKTAKCLAISFMLLLPLLTGNAQSASPPLFVIVQNGRYGYIDNTGKVVVQPQFVWAGEFKNGSSDVYVCGRMASIDEKGNLLPRVRRSKLEARKVGDKFGFVDASGQLKIPAQYDAARWFSEGLAAVRVGMKWGYIDETGRTVIAFEYASAMEFKHGRALVTFGELRRAESGIQEIAVNNDRHGVIDPSGRILAKGLDTIGAISEARMAAEKNERWGYLDVNGTVVIPFIYEEAHPFADGLAAVQREGKWGYVDKNGEVIIPFIYEEAVNFSEGQAVVKKEGKSGYIDIRGNVTIGFEFEEADNFQAGLAAVRKGEETGFIDKSGNFLFKLAFFSARDFRDSHDLSRFWTKDERFGYVDYFGRVVWQSVGPETIEPLQFPQWLQEHREASCVGIPEDLKKKVADFPPEL